MLDNNNPKVLTLVLCSRNYLSFISSKAQQKIWGICQCDHWRPVQEHARKSGAHVPHCRDCRRGDEVPSNWTHHQTHSRWNGWFTTELYGAALSQYFCWRTQFPWQIRICSFGEYAKSRDGYRKNLRTYCKSNQITMDRGEKLEAYYTKAHPFREGINFLREILFCIFFSLTINSWPQTLFFSCANCWDPLRDSFLRSREKKTSNFCRLGLLFFSSAN